MYRQFAKSFKIYYKSEIKENFNRVIPSISTFYKTLVRKEFDIQAETKKLDEMIVPENVSSLNKDKRVIRRCIHRQELKWSKFNIFFIYLQLTGLSYHIYRPDQLSLSIDTSSKMGPCIYH